MLENTQKNMDRKIKAILEDIIEIIETHEQQNRTFHALHVIVLKEILKKSPDLHLEITEKLKKLASSDQMLDKETLKRFIAVIKVDEHD